MTNNLGGVTQNCVIPYTGWPNCINYIQNSDPSFPYQIRLVANGYILKINYNEYVFECIDSLTKFLKEKLKVQK